MKNTKKIAVVRYDYLVAVCNQLSNFFGSPTVDKIVQLGQQKIQSTELQLRLRTAGIDSVDDRIPKVASWKNVVSDETHRESLLVLVSDVQWALFMVEVLGQTNLPAATVCMTLYNESHGDWNAIVDENAQLFDAQ